MVLTFDPQLKKILTFSVKDRYQLNYFIWIKDLNTETITSLKWNLFSFFIGCCQHYETKTIFLYIFLISDRYCGTEHQYLFSRFLGVSTFTAGNRHKQNSWFCKEIREDNFRFWWRRVHEDASQGMYMSKIESFFLLLEYCKIRECYAVANAFTIRNMYSLFLYMKCNSRKINRPTKNMTKIVTLLHF